MTNPIELSKHVADKFHAGQMYGDQPYTVHLEAVFHMIVRMNPDDERLRVIARLHDVLEDTKCTEEVLRALFEDDVVEAVVAMTKGHFNHMETRDQYLIRCRSNALAREVKKADTFCNLRESLIRGDMKRVKRYGEQLAVLATV